MISFPAMPNFAKVILSLRMFANTLPQIQRQPTRAAEIAVPKSKRSPQVSLVGAGPGSADLITLRGLERIKSADIIFYDRLADPALLRHARPKAMLVYVGKAPGCHSKSQPEINALLVKAALSGQMVVRLKCGDPGIFARGAEEAEALTEAGITWEIIPGVTSACAAAASAGSFLTERGATERLIFATGHLRHDGAQDWATTAQPGTTLACYMGVAQAAKIMQGLLHAGWPADCSVQVISKAQTIDERVFNCKLDGLVTLCETHGGLNPAIILLRWTLNAENKSQKLAQPVCRSATTMQNAVTT
jgi:uroporphyrin-III C-methyltransferase